MNDGVGELTVKSVYKWTNALLKNLKMVLNEHDFNEILPAIISQRYEPGANHSIAVLGDQMLPDIKSIDVEDGSTLKNRIIVSGKDYYYLPVSHVVEKQMALEHLQKVYCIAPCLRLVMKGEEMSGKHLYNFFQCEIEWRTESIEDVFETGEKIIVQAITNLADHLSKDKDIQFINDGERNLNSILKSNFPIITFNEALKLLKKPAHKGDLSQEDDMLLSNMFDRPFWIYDYPSGIRDSIYHKNSRGTYDTYDLMLPFGYGELTTGGVRPKTGQEIIEQSQLLGKKYNPLYADWKTKAKIQTAGFGIGLERLLRFLSGAKSILSFIQYHDHGPNQHLKSIYYN